jgi:regulatory protein YycI of two-component signal transduction system YycFG
MFNQFINERNTLNAHRKRIMSMAIKNNEYRSYKSSLLSFFLTTTLTVTGSWNAILINLLMSTFTMGR